jgi:hypothetical protein
MKRANQHPQTFKTHYVKTSFAPSSQREDLSFVQSGLGKSSDDDCMVLECLNHLKVFLPKHLATMRRLLQDAECKEQGFAPK